MAIVPFYAALLSILLLYLSVRVIRLRRKFKVAIGDGGNMVLQRAMCVHNNFCQYVPLTLLLLTYNELKNMPELLLQTLCCALLLGRIIHAWGVSHNKEKIIFRMIGMGLTFAVIAISVLSIIILSF